MMSVRCLPVHFARLACYAFVILGFPVECVRPAADSVLAKEALIDDVCCCKTQMKKGFSDSPLLPIKEWKVQYHQALLKPYIPKSLTPNP